jgi:predicted nicotinamide N-methyase
MARDDYQAPPHLPSTPREAIQSVLHETVLIDGRSFKITRPAESDRLLDHPAVRAAFAADEYMPYWTDLWPAARMLAKAILRETWPHDLETLEIGCGLGLPGISALAQGLRVTFSDYDATALHFAADNARANGYHDFRLLQLDWRCPPANLRIPVLLGSDLIYETRNVEPLVHFIQQVLAPEGVCLLSDQDRIPSQLLRDTLASAGLAFTIRVMHAGEPGGRRLRGSLYRITRAHPSDGVP